MKKSTFTPEGVAFRAKLVAMRKAAGLTQRDLAKRLRREHSFVARIEQGERRLDVIEFFWVCKACGIRPEKAAPEIMRTIAVAGRAKKRTR